MIARYELDQNDIVQVHPVHGRRTLIRADGHGQLVWVGEVEGSLLIFDRWSVMGYKDGTLRVRDPDTLASKAVIYLDLDAVGILGFEGRERFVLSELAPGKTAWRAWRLDNWEPMENAEPAARAQVQSLTGALTCMVDLPRAPRTMP